MIGRTVSWDDHEEILHTQTQSGNWLERKVTIGQVVHIFFFFK